MIPLRELKARALARMRGAKVEPKSAPEPPKPKAQPENPTHDPRDPPVVLQLHHPDGRVERVTVRMSEAVKLISPRGWY